MKTEENSEYDSENSKTQPKIIIKGLVSPIILPSNKYYGLLQQTYRKNQIIVTFQSNPSEKEIETVKGFFHQMEIKGPIEIVKCGSGDCDLPVQLWLADGIDTIISGKGVTAGTGPGTKTVGESYSLNFLSNIPQPDWDQSNHNFHVLEEKHDTKEAVTIAVLDTGIDPYIVDMEYIGKNLKNEHGLGCFNDPGNGWNFVANNDDIEDDSPGRHGSLVTQFIINEFKKSSKKTVRIIPLKTHDLNGEGDLFKIFCAVYYAIAKGAKIINASWGFYYYDKLPFKQLDFLIKTVSDKGILFITAAGNQSDIDDAIAKEILALEGIDATPSELRDLDVHQFLPACISESAKNLITVTTTNEDEVAATENYSKNYVDIGVIADKAENGDLWFKVPFKNSSRGAVVRGSSFATAIATGVICANCDKGLYTDVTIDKQSFIKELKGANLCEVYPLLEDLIRNGIGIKK